MDNETSPLKTEPVLTEHSPSIDKNTNNQINTLLTPQPILTPTKRNAFLPAFILAAVWALNCYISILKIGIIFLPSFVQLLSVLGLATANIIFFLLYFSILKNFQEYAKKIYKIYFSLCLATTVVVFVILALTPAPEAFPMPPVLIMFVTAMPSISGPGYIGYMFLPLIFYVLFAKSKKLLIILLIGTCLFAAGTISFELLSNSGAISGKSNIANILLTGGSIYYIGNNKLYYQDINNKLHESDIDGRNDKIISVDKTIKFINSIDFIYKNCLYVRSYGEIYKLDLKSHKTQKIGENIGKINLQYLDTGYIYFTWTDASTYLSYYKLDLNSDKPATLLATIPHFNDYNTVYNDTVYYIAHISDNDYSIYQTETSVYSSTSEITNFFADKTNLYFTIGTSLHRYNILDKTDKILLDTQNANLHIIKNGTLSNRYFFYDENNNIYEFDSSNNLLNKLDVQIGNTKSNPPTSVYIFNNKLYFATWQGILIFDEINKTSETINDVYVYNFVKADDKLYYALKEDLLYGAKGKINSIAL